MSEQVSDLFSEAMLELKEIRRELASINTALTLNAERQLVASQHAERVEKRVEKLEKQHAECPARNSHQSFGNVFNKVALFFALILSVASVLQIIFLQSK
jgi:hypothetical protein